MKNTLVLSIVMSFLFLASTNIMAQNHRGNHGNRGNKVMVEKKGYHKKYHRKNVVVVRKRNGRVISVLPNNYVTCVHRKNNYYYHEGLYYRQLNNQYHLIFPPYGVRIRVLPAGCRKILMYGKPHYFYQGVYYKPVGNEFVTVKPEIGTIIPEIPQEMTEQVKVDGNVYYEIDNYLYKAVDTPDGSQYAIAGELDDETQE